MSNISESLLDSISILSKATLQGQNLPKIVMGNIIELLDPTIGQYSVSYLGQTLKAYSNNIAIKYAKDDIVYILCQDGQLDGTLVIIGAKVPYAGLYKPSSPKSMYMRLSDSLITNINNSNTIELCTYRNQDFFIERDNFDLLGGSNFTTLANDYLNNKHRLFCFSMNVKTDIKNIYQRVQGNYGIELILPFKLNDTPIEKRYMFDINKMSGNPYGLEIFTNQTQYILLEEGLEFDDSTTPRIRVFINGFPKTDSDPTIPADVFIKDIEFYFVDRVEESVFSGYYLSLTPTQGPYFAGDAFSSTKVIEANLLIDNEEINSDKLTFYWFERDAHITTASDKYRAEGGNGWRYLKDGEGDNKLEISVNDISNSSEFKAVVIYNEQIVSQTINIINLESKIDFKMESNKCVIENISNVNIDLSVIYKEGLVKTGTLEYYFTRYDHTGNLLDTDFYQISKPETENRIDNKTVSYDSQITFPSRYITDGMNLICCEVYAVDAGGNGRKIGSKEIAIITLPNSDYTLSMENSNIVYKYDGDGMAPKALIKPLNYSIYKSIGEEFDTTEYAYCKTIWYLPKTDTMFDNFILPPEINIASKGVSEDGLYDIIAFNGKADIGYTIRSQYNNSYVNNNVFVEVQCDAQGTVLRGYTNITFLKDGAQGTNGTNYSAFITYNGNRYNKDNTQKNVKLYSIGGKWKLKKDDGSYVDYNNSSESLWNVKFEIEIYKNEDRVIETSVPITWNIYNAKEDSSYFLMEGNKLVSNRNWENISDAQAIMVQATAKLGGGTNEDDDPKYIRAYYPIEIIYLDNSETKVPDITGGFSEVLYGADGANAKINGTNIFASNIEDLTNKWSYSYNLKENPSYFEKTDEQKEWEKTHIKIYPRDNFEIAQPDNYVRLEVKDETQDPSVVSAIFIRPILCMINTYGFNYMNEWDGGKVDVEDGSIMAPLVGAGVKNNDNTFSGVVIGQSKKIDDSRIIKETGLMAYDRGQRTVFINSDTGAASFGKSGSGQIIIDGEKSIITGGGYDESLYNKEIAYDKNEQGMRIDLNGDIRFGSKNFLVNKEGHLTARNGGSIAGWEIGKTTLSSNSTNTEETDIKQGFVIDAERKAFYSNKRFTLKNISEKGIYFGQEGIGIDNIFKVDIVDEKPYLKLGVEKKVKVTSGIKNYFDEFDTDQADLKESPIYWKIGSLDRKETKSDIVTKEVRDPVTGKVTIEVEDFGEQTIEYTTPYIGLDIPDSYDPTKGRKGSLYLGSDYVTFGNTFKFNIDNGELELGKLSSSTHWTVKSSNDNAALTYNSKGFGTGQVYLGTDGISLGGNNFKVDKDGNLSANNGDIAGIDINKEGLYKDFKEGTRFNNIDEAIENRTSNNCFYIGPGGIAIGSTVIENKDVYRFKVDRSGRLTATDVTLAGNITATSGIFGGWKLNKTFIESIGSEDEKESSGKESGLILDSRGEIRSKNREWYINKDGTAKFTKVNIGVNEESNCSFKWGERFEIYPDGTVRCESADIKGKITAFEGEIGGFIIGKKALYNQKTSFNIGGPGVYLGIDGISLGDGFKVDSYGNLSASKVNITGGTFNVGKVSISSGGIKSSDKFYINSDGTGKIGVLDLDSDGGLKIGQVAKFASSTVTIGGFVFSTNLCNNSGGTIQCSQLILGEYVLKPADIDKLHKL